ncbi:hypothetical protein K438DRAFT_1759992 [Mycena galopus ATCC 62051]|nr:hypothetical protein K438DRAFT_1759992 [Mycena galopus ATCC 62051]
MAKEMFALYQPDDVPDSMPFPGLCKVATSKGEEVAVPDLNKYQQSWIHDVALRGSNLPHLDKKTASDLYEKIKDDAFDTKAFSHVVQPGDAAEEATIPELVAAWKRKQSTKGKKKGKAATDEDDEDDVEEDADPTTPSDRATLLRGYTLTGWRAVRILSARLVSARPLT